MHQQQVPQHALLDVALALAEQVAQVVAFVASDEASAVNGSILTVDQGHTAG